MNTMTQEEKAKRYDEIIVRAKKYLEDCPDRVDARGCIEHLIPSLKDSEDERIRKWIIENIQETLDVDGFFEGQKTMAKNAIAWLKSLKDRVQPQKQWKPSEEQMKILAKAANCVSEMDAAILKGLLENLKML